jgi:hypothetical protein
MNTSRLRFVGALLALFALSLFYAESVMASLCPPEIVVEAPASEDGSRAPVHGGMHHGPSGPEKGSAPEGSHTEPCPMAAASMSGSCVASALPMAATIDVPADAPEAAQAVASTDAKDLLLAAPLFHPPRA